MEKPSGLIEKVIDSLHVINGIQTPYSLIEKEIVLQHIRAAYLQLINIPATEEVQRTPIQLPDLSMEKEKTQEDLKLKEEHSKLLETNTLLQEQVDLQKGKIETLEQALNDEKQKQTNFEHYLTELNNSNLAQKNELESLLLELDEKDKIIEHLKKELELVLLRETELEEKDPKIETANKTEIIFEPEPIVVPVPEIKTVPIVFPEPEVIPEPVVVPQPEVIPEPVVVPQPEVIPEPVVVPQPEVIPEPVVIHVTEPVKEKEKKVDPIIDEMDDILEFTHPQQIKQEQKPPIGNTQPLLFVEEKEGSKPEKKSLNDLLTEKKEDNSLGSKFQQSKIHDLTKAISINDKFLFIRELFRSKGEEFSSSLHKLNNCTNIEEAFNVMEELKNYYFWDTTSSAYLSLCDLVRRKFL